MPRISWLLMGLAAILTACSGSSSSSGSGQGKSNPPIQKESTVGVDDLNMKSGSPMTMLPLKDGSYLGLMNVDFYDSSKDKNLSVLKVARYREAGVDTNFSKNFDSTLQYDLKGAYGFEMLGLTETSDGLIKVLLQRNNSFQSGKSGRGLTVVSMTSEGFVLGAKELEAEASFWAVKGQTTAVEGTLPLFIFDVKTKSTHLGAFNWRDETLSSSPFPLQSPACGPEGKQPTGARLDNVYFRNGMLSFYAKWTLYGCSSDVAHPFVVVSHFEGGDVKNSYLAPQNDLSAAIVAADGSLWGMTTGGSDLDGFIGNLRLLHIQQNGYTQEYNFSTGPVIGIQLYDLQWDAKGRLFVAMSVTNEDQSYVAQLKGFEFDSANKPVMTIALAYSFPGRATQAMAERIFKVEDGSVWVQGNKNPDGNQDYAAVYHFQF